MMRGRILSRLLRASTNGETGDWSRCGDISCTHQTILQMRGQDFRYIRQTGK
jgi:hypothetical protein